jgi:DNA polymerase-3 subunit delta'
VSWNLIGNQWAQDLLRAHVASERARHAYLITGPTAIGKRTLALRFAQALNCEHAVQLGDVCQQEDCRPCQLIPTERYPDLHIVAPEESIKIEQVRRLQSRLALAPYEGRWQVAVLHDFQFATESAANAMLKLLEEPPPKVVLILTAPSDEDLLPTVVSRCELLALRPVDHQTLTDALRTRGADQAQAELLATLSGGRPGMAIALMQDEQRLAQRISDARTLSLMLERDVLDRFAEVESLIGKGKLPVQRKRVLETLGHWASILRDLVHEGYRADTMRHNPDLLEEASGIASGLSPGQRYAALQSVTAAQQAVLRNANLRLTLEAVLLDLPEAQRRTSAAQRPTE